MADISRFGEAVAKAAEREQARQIEEEVERRKKIVSSAYSEAARYNNLIVGMGYVAFFTLIGALGDTISPEVKRGASLMMVGSVVFFIGFEVYKVLETTLMFRRLAGDLRTAKSAEVLAATETVNRRVAFRLMRVWPFVFIPTVFLGFGAAGWLSWELVRCL